MVNACDDESGDDKIIAIVAFSFYDGPESGLALLSSGKSVRFFAFAESPSRMFRAFAFFFLEGEWLERAQLACEKPRFDSDGQLWWGSGDRFERLVYDVERAGSTECLIGVGRPYLEDLKLARLSDEELGKLTALSDPFAFRMAHRFVKSQRGGLDRINGSPCC